MLRGLSKRFDNPLEEAKASALLGSAGFAVWVKEQFPDVKILKGKDYPGLKKLKKSVLAEEVAEAVAEEYGIKPEEIPRAQSKWREARQVVIELSYQLNFRKKSLQKLGEELEGIGGDGIAHTHQRIQKK